MNESALAAVGALLSVERMAERERTVIPSRVVGLQCRESAPERELESPKLPARWRAPQAEVPDAVEAPRQDVL